MLIAVLTSALLALLLHSHGSRKALSWDVHLWYRIALDLRDGVMPYRDSSFAKPPPILALLLIAERCGGLDRGLLVLHAACWAVAGGAIYAVLSRWLSPLATLTAIACILLATGLPRLSTGSQDIECSAVALSLLAFCLTACATLGAGPASLLVLSGATLGLAVQLRPTLIGAALPQALLIAMGMPRPAAVASLVALALGFLGAVAAVTWWVSRWCGIRQYVAECWLRNARYAAAARRSSRSRLARLWPKLVSFLGMQAVPLALAISVGGWACSGPYDSSKVVGQAALLLFIVDLVGVLPGGYGFAHYFILPAGSLGLLLGLPARGLSLSPPISGVPVRILVGFVWLLVVYIGQSLASGQRTTREVDHSLQPVVSWFEMNVPHDATVLFWLWNNLDNRLLWMIRRPFVGKLFCPIPYFHWSEEIAWEWLIQARRHPPQWIVVGAERSWLMGQAVPSRRPGEWFRDDPRILGLSKEWEHEYQLVLEQGRIQVWHRGAGQR